MLIMLLRIKSRRCLAVCYLQLVMLLPEGHINLQSNSSLLKETFGSPVCEIGTRICLVSYNYQYKECIAGQCRDNIKAISPLHAYYLHEMCSFKETCSNTTSLISTNDSPSTNVTKIEYQCVGLDDWVIHICSEGSWVTNQTTRLIYYNDGKIKMTNDDYVECKCFVKNSLKNSLFTVTLNDIRLTVPNGRSCSSSKLQLNSEVFVCKDTEAGYGSIFNYVNQRLVSRAYLSLLKSEVNDNPAMVWLTVEPVGTVLIVCEVIIYKTVASKHVYSTTTTNSMMTENSVLTTEDAVTRTEVIEDSPSGNQSNTGEDTLEVHTKTEGTPTENTLDVYQMKEEAQSPKQVTGIIMKFPGVTGENQNDQSPGTEKEHHLAEYSYLLSPRIGDIKVPPLVLIATGCSIFIGWVIFCAVMVIVLKRNAVVKCQRNNHSVEQNTSDVIKHSSASPIYGASGQSNIRSNGQEDCISDCIFDETRPKVMIRVNPECETSEYQEISEIGASSDSTYEKISMDQLNDYAYYKLLRNEIYTVDGKSPKSKSRELPPLPYVELLDMETTSHFSKSLVDDYLQPLRRQDVVDQNRHSSDPSFDYYLHPVPMGDNFKSNIPDTNKE